MINSPMASDIAKFLDAELIGNDYFVKDVKALDHASSGALMFAKDKNFSLPSDIACVVLCPLDYENRNAEYSVIRVKNPRLSFAKSVTYFFSKKPKPEISKTVKIGNNCNIDPSVSAGENCVIGDNVTIGCGTVINHNVVIFDNTKIGAHCYIKSGAVIGEDGFGFDFEEDKSPVRIPHLGNVVIGDYVEIGSNTNIARATLGSTVIGSHVKIDDQVFIAHNCQIGEKTLIVAFAEVSGSVKIGKRCWIAPNSSIIQKVVIGDDVTIGIGAVVTGDVGSGTKVMGLEALNLRALLKLKKRIDFGM